MSRVEMYEAMPHTANVAHGEYVFLEMVAVMLAPFGTENVP
jgi:hypothetical protein